MEKKKEERKENKKFEPNAHETRESL